MATCMYCNAQIPDGLKFCTACGAALPVEATNVQQPYQQPVDQQPYQEQYQQPGFQQPAGQQSYQQPYQQPGQPQPTYIAPSQQPVTDSGSIGWGVLGFFIPIVGLVLFLVWKNTKPKCAKVAGIGALISVCISAVYYIFIAVGMS